MAQCLQIQGRFGYRHVTLDKIPDNSLGIGSYGAVYKARCDQLPCAAKVLHPILFSTRDPSARRIVQRFEQECQFLSDMRHPNVIQYLGTCRDLESGQPILFMELMDDSLTSFLEQCGIALPFRTQVNIACDVAQALAYLHSHEIIHRDLSSNNVLLIGDSRAKVTDFGMSKLSDSLQMTTPRALTQLPGTEVYMPPEAFLEPPEYSNKLDCFSLGVLGIQIITRQFPKPGPRRTSVQVPQSELFPTGRAERLVSEEDRRREHISLVPDQDHPLLKVCLACLNDDDNDRPSAEQLCSRLADLKELPLFQEPDEVEESSEEPCSPSTSVEVLEALQELERMTERALASEQLVAEFQVMLDQKEVLLQGQEKILGEMKERLRLKDIAIREKEAALLEKAQQVRDLQGLHWEKGPDSPIPILGECSAVHENKAYFCDAQSESRILEFTSNTGEWSVIECPRKHFSIAVVNGLLTAISGEQSGKFTESLLSLKVQSRWFGFSQGMAWIEEFPPMKHYHRSPAVASTKTALIVAGGWSIDMGTTEVLDTDTLQWFTAASLARPLSYTSAAISGDSLYVGGGFLSGEPTKSVLRCSVSDLLQSTASGNLSGAPVWRDIAELPVSFSTLVTFRGQLLAVGGQKGRDLTTAVYRYDAASNSWRVFSYMCVQRLRCLAAVLPGDKMIVVGGDAKKTSVELGASPC